MMNENDLAKQFFEFDGRLRRYFAAQRHKQGKAGSPHRGQGRVLTLLSMRDNMSQKDLAFILGLRPQSVGELLGKLEKNEWITRTPSEDDKRMMLVSLTEAGKEEAQRIAEESTNTTDLFDIFSEEEKNQFSSLIEKLNAEISKRVGEDFDERKSFMERFDDERFFEGDHPHHHGPGHHPHHGPGHHHHHHPHHCDKMEKHHGPKDFDFKEPKKNGEKNTGDAWTDF